MAHHSIRTIRRTAVLLLLLTVLRAGLVGPAPAGSGFLRPRRPTPTHGQGTGDHLEW